MRRFNTLRTGHDLSTIALGVTLVLTLLWGAGTSAWADDDLEDKLSQVGAVYGEAYSSPFIYAHGPNQNSAMYQSAHIPWSGLTFGIGVKVMATRIKEEDQYFQKVLEDEDLGKYDPDYAGQTGDVVMSGPTIFGNTEQVGSVKGYVGGTEVFNIPTITGLYDTRMVPLAAPEAYVGGLVGLKLTLRYFPELSMGSYGKTKYFGYGLQWNINGLLKDLPVDIMVGFFNQQLKVGSLIDSNASTIFAGVSHDFSPVTLYGGLAAETSDMTVAYTFVEEDQDVSFEVDGRQKSRFTLGATLDILLKLNLEMAYGKMATYSAGLMFGF